MKCAGCGGQTRSYSMAIVLRGRRARMGRVCGDCTRRGFFMVTFEQKPLRVKKAEKRVRVRKRGAFVSSVLATEPVDPRQCELFK